GRNTPRRPHLEQNTAGAFPSRGTANSIHTWRWWSRECSQYPRASRSILAWLGIFGSVSIDRVGEPLAAEHVRDPEHPIFDLAPGELLTAHVLQVETILQQADHDHARAELAVAFEPALQQPGELRIGPDQSASFDHVLTHRRPPSWLARGRAVARAGPAIPGRPGGALHAGGYPAVA